MTVDEAWEELRRFAEPTLRKLVIAYAAESGVHPNAWLAKCTIDVSFTLADGEVKMDTVARKRVPADGLPRLTFE